MSAPLSIPETQAGTSAPPPTAEPGSLSPVDKQTQTNLERLLGQRPDKEELVDKNILRGGPAGMDPSLAAKRMELEKSLLEDKLNTALQHRPQPEELVKEGILSEDEAPKIEGTVEATQNS